MKYQEKHLVNKFNMILDNQGRLMLNDQKIPFPNKPHRSPGFVQKKSPEVFCKKRISENQTLIFQKKFFISFNDSPSKMMKNAFYFIVKALFVLEMFKFLS